MKRVSQHILFLKFIFIIQGIMMIKYFITYFIFVRVN